MELVKYVPYRESLINGKKAAMERLDKLEKMCDPLTTTEQEWERISNEMDDCIDAIVSYDARIKTYDKLNLN